MTSLQEKQLVSIYDYASTKLISDKTGHDMSHINRVVRYAKDIQKKEGGSEFIILSAAILHDVLDDKLVDNPEEAERELIDFLYAIKVSSIDITHILECISKVSFSGQLGKCDTLSLEAKIVQDADRLDAIGAIGIARTFYYGGGAGHIMYDDDILPREDMTKQEYRINQTVINHFYEKLFKLGEMMQTESAKELAVEKTDFMRNFVEKFEAEWG